MNLTDAQISRSLRIFPSSTLKIGEIQKVIGSYFPGTTLDAVRYTTTLANAGTVTLAAGLATLNTNTTANGSAILQTSISARKRVGKDLYTSITYKLSNTGTTNNIRRWGKFDANNGAFFQLSGTTWSVVVRKATVDTVVASSSWIGNHTAQGSSVLTVDANVHTAQIYETTTAIQFWIDGQRVHKASTTLTPIYENFDLPLRAENTNSSGITTSLGLSIIDWGVFSVGTGEDIALEYTLNNVAETRTLLTGSGKLMRVIVNTIATGACTLSMYDALSATGTPKIIDLTKTGTYIYNSEVFTGLTYVTSAALGQNVTIQYS